MKNRQKAVTRPIQTESSSYYQTFCESNLEKKNEYSEEQKSKISNKKNDEFNNQKSKSQSWD